MKFSQDLEARKLIHQISSPAVLDKINDTKMSVYVGFDPTAPSLHVGSLLPLITMKRFSEAGHHVVVLIGGGTGMIGDPSGKQSKRKLLTTEDVKRNSGGILSQIKNIISGDGVTVVDNADWICDLKLTDFLRNTGKYFSVNSMIARDSVRTRLNEREQGISFTEFTYMLLQAYDFMELNDRHGCTLQIGGSDQWGNIVSGVDLIKRSRGKDAYGLTFPLLTRSDGRKFGKSESGNIWLDPSLTSPYDFFQFWINTHDSDVEKYLLCLTMESVEAISAVMAEHKIDPTKRIPQRLLANELTAMVHGKDTALAMSELSEAIFGSADLNASSLLKAPDARISSSDIVVGKVSLISILVDAGLCDSKSKAKTAILQGGVSLNGEVVDYINRMITMDDVGDGGVILVRFGKKRHGVVAVDGY